MFGAIGGALLGQAAGGLLGGLFGDSGVDAANRANAILRQQIENQFKALGVQQALRFRDAEAAKTALLGDVMGDFDRAEARVEGGGRQTKRDVVAAGQRTQGAIDQNMISRGLNASTISANAQRGVQADVSRGMASVDAGVNNALAGLTTQRAGFRSALGGDIANLPLQRLGFEQDTGLARVNWLNSITNTARPGNGAAIGGSLGSLAGFALGGGFGGWGGGSAGTFSGLADPGMGGMGGWFA